MLLYFDNNGVLKEILDYGAPARTGTTNFKIIAYFEGINLVNTNTATLKLIRPDLGGTDYPLLFMLRNIEGFTFDSSIETSSFFVNGEQYPVFEFDFANFSSDNNLVLLLDTPGTWKAVVSLYTTVDEQQTISVQGIASFYVQSGAYEPETGTELDTDLLMNMIAIQLSTKANVQDIVIDLGTMSSGTSVGDLRALMTKKALYSFVFNSFVFIGFISKVSGNNTNLNILKVDAGSAFTDRWQALNSGDLDLILLSNLLTHSSSYYKPLATEAWAEAYIAEQLANYYTKSESDALFEEDNVVKVTGTSGRLSAEELTKIGADNAYIEKSGVYFHKDNANASAAYFASIHITGNSNELFADVKIIMVNLVTGDWSVIGNSFGTYQKNKIDSLLETIRRNSFIEVNTATYPTLESFLSSTGQEGFVYLYPVNVSDLTQGYYQYIWEENRWLGLGSTQFNISNYYTKGETNLLLGGKVDKTNDANKIYGTGSGGVAMTYNIGTGVNANYIPQRDGNGQVSVPETQTENGQATSKKYVDDADATKVDKVSAASKVYGTNEGGYQTTYSVSESASESAIVKRRGTAVVVPETPTNNDEAASKKYVDDVREVAEGKCETFIISYANHLSAGYFASHNVFDKDGNRISPSAVENGDYDNYLIVNSEFNSNNNEISILFFNEEEQKYNYIFYYYRDKEYLTSFEDFYHLFHTGDIVLVIEVDVPDRWFSGIIASYNVPFGMKFDKLETSKIDLTNYVTLNGTQDITGSKTFTSTVTVKGPVASGANVTVENAGTGDKSYYGADYISHYVASFSSTQILYFPTSSGTVALTKQLKLDIGEASSHNIEWVYNQAENHRDLFAIEITGTKYLASISLSNDLYTLKIWGKSGYVTYAPAAGSTSVMSLTSVARTTYYNTDASVVPDADNQYDIGSSSYKFKDAYLSNSIKLGNFNIGINSSGELAFSDTITYKSIKIGNNFLPNSNSTYTLGLANYRWTDLYLSGKVDLSSSTKTITLQNVSDELKVVVGNFSLYMNDGTLHCGSGNRDLGAIQYRWNNLYLSSSIQFNNSTTYVKVNNDNDLLLNASGGTIWAERNLKPTGNGTKDLGATSNKWNNVWFNNLKGGATLTQAEYDALVEGGTVDADTFYFIEEE